MTEPVIEIARIALKMGFAEPYDRTKPLREAYRRIEESKTFKGWNGADFMVIERQLVEDLCVEIENLIRE